MAIYVKELPEDAEPSTIVVSVKAIHVSNLPIYYSMIAPQDSRSQNIFTLDTISGDILLAKSLDREVLDKHVLKVTAYERIDPTISASATVIIDVLDVQDNSPMFERDSYFADIREDAPVSTIGTTVLSVFARDLDAGLNGDVEYSLGQGQGVEYLSIHTKSGVIQTAAPLDRETAALIRLDVVASDKGDLPRKSSALIEIGIIDVNDNAPVFEKDFYNITVMENSTLPASLIRVKATDKDSGINGQVHYSIVATSSVPLTIDYSTGEVTLRDRLDARHSPFSVLLRAKDGAQPALSSTATLTIHLIDINDHAPTFIASKKEILLEENVPVGEEVGRVYAIDEDSGDNGRVKYFLEGSSDFYIDSDSGVIKTTNLLDRENISQYDIKVIASDMSSEPQQTSTFITIILKDVNDNAPLFEKSEYNLTLLENTPRGSQIMVLKAEDKDSDQKIVYRIEHVDKDIVALIDLGEQGALLSLSGPLNSVDHYIRVEISATDQGGQQGRCTVNIHVEDVNSAPFFTEQPFSIRIPEDSPVGFHVITMKVAEDTDRDGNAYLTYSIDSKDFTINKESGLITVTTQLNREEKSSYTITVSVSDGGVPPLSSSIQIEVIIDDVNDNAPQFSSQNYTASIPEDIAVGTSFLQVSATDLDIGNNGVVDYFLNESDPTVRKDLFRLDRTSGTLRVNSRLDREQTATINLSVFARDRGKPFLTSSSVITITLSDINDNAPMFDQSSYDLYIAENSPVGSTVGTIIATDPDDGENALIQFRIFGGADAKFGQLSSTVPVRIHVSDVNDNRPLLKDFVVLINQFEEQPFHREIGMIPAFDPDQNATLEFYLEENDLIIADKYTGKITLSSQWKRNVEATFKTCVSDGPNTVCAQCRLVHVYVEVSWLRESVSVSLPRVGLDDFWDPSIYRRFKQSLSVLDKWKPENIHVLGTRKTEEGIDVSFVVIDKGRLIRISNQMHLTGHGKSKDL
uniref:Cadherin domain-containing protein n=1 Tax=Heterorhabditis bacteriophora TaxID=37862 RepID=A0A1I7XG09_HETBA